MSIDGHVADVVIIGMTVAQRSSAFVVELDRSKQMSYKNVTTRYVTCLT